MSSFYIYQHNPCERVAYLVVYALIQKKSRGKPQKPSKKWTAVLKLETPDT